ncbi:putative Zinc-containing alcohol dehydrogenase [Pleurostoma richardsiae]|uniref:Zinc-containing alcohol dehydrogenase n=1 Tax=Pleurostoma richardsiae TaxID=41990 RepID=A0AA38R4P0_9PEZI|nr:putative Zinc-containing alcohol dehydrogenase [Pleurostoma richardsiae]
MARQWVLNSQKGFEVSLEYQENVKVLSASELEPDEVLVEIHAASLNYRDIVIASPNGVNGPIQAPIVPGCDGAGIVKAVGPSVQEFHPGDQVLTYFAPELVKSSGNDAQASLSDVPFMLGQGNDGTLRSEGVFSETALVHAPKSLGWLTAATLTCTWTTAWNILFGLKGREARSGTWVLVQGTGGVSVATLQLATAAGATVVATTSTEDKATRLRSLGAMRTVNYRVNPGGWGREARNLTPDGRGFDFVVDIGGNETLPQSLTAVRVDGIVSAVGQVGDESEPVPLSAALLHTCIVRGLFAGSRSQFQEIVRYIDEKGIVPAVDDVVFELGEIKGAYRRLKEKKHFSKVVIRVAQPEA